MFYYWHDLAVGWGGTALRCIELNEPDAAYREARQAFRMAAVSIYLGERT